MIDGLTRRKGCILPRRSPPDAFYASRLRALRACHVPSRFAHTFCPPSLSPTPLGGGCDAGLHDYAILALTTRTLRGRRHRQPKPLNTSYRCTPCARGSHGIATVTASGAMRSLLTGCNHWARVSHLAPTRQKLCAPRSRPHPAVSAATRDPFWRRCMRAVRACPCAEAHRHASTRVVIVATLTPRSGLSRHADGANPTVARPLCRRVGEPCRSAHGTPSGGS